MNNFKFKFLLIIPFIFLVFFSANTFAIETISGYDLSIFNQTFNTDLYLGSSIITFNSIVYGDLLLLGLDIYTKGFVSEDVIVLGANVNINSDVNGDLRVFALNSKINSFVGENLVIYGSRINIEEETIIYGNSLLNGNFIELNNKFIGNLEVKANKVVLNSVINGDLNLKYDEIDVYDDFLIKGNLNYTSDTRNLRLESKVIGDVEFNQFIVDSKLSYFNFLSNFGYVLGKLSWMVLLLIIGLIVITFLPNFSMEVVNNIAKKPISSFFLGIIVIIGIPFAIFIFIMTLIGIPLGLFLTGFYALIMVFTRIFFILFIGLMMLNIIIRFSNEKHIRANLRSKTNKKEKIKKSNKDLSSKLQNSSNKYLNNNSYIEVAFQKKYTSYFLGIILYTILSFIPIVSIVVSSIATVISAGSFALAKYSSIMFWKKKKNH